MCIHQALVVGIIMRNYLCYRSYFKSKCFNIWFRSFGVKLSLFFIWVSCFPICHSSGEEEEVEQVV